MSMKMFFMTSTSFQLRKLRASGLALFAAIVVVLALPRAASAQSMQPRSEGAKVDNPNAANPASLANVGIDQKLDTQVPLDATFKDDFGTQVTLANYFGPGHDRPAILALVYYGCPRLCTTVLNQLKNAMMPMTLDPGKDFELIVISFDPREGPALAAEKKDSYTKLYRRPGTEKGWHFLTGDEANIRKVTDAVGFRYGWDEKNQQFVHAAGIMVLTPQGKTSQYFYGTDYNPRDLRQALVIAGQGKTGTIADKVLLFCFEYDPSTGKYTFAIMKVVQVAGGLTVLAMATFIVVNVRRHNRRMVDVRAKELAEREGDETTSDDQQTKEHS
jgi:protein SCO1/2